MLLAQLRPGEKAVGGADGKAISPVYRGELIAAALEQHEIGAGRAPAQAREDRLKAGAELRAGLVAQAQGGDGLFGEKHHQPLQQPGADATPPPEGIHLEREQLGAAIGAALGDGKAHHHTSGHGGEAEQFALDAGQGTAAGGQRGEGELGVGGEVGGGEVEHPLVVDGGVG